MSSGFSTSAALRFTEEELGGPCLENESNPTCLTSITTLAQGNGDRVGLVMINLGANPVNVSISSGASASNGILLAANGGLVTMSVRDDFTLPSRQWSGIATGGTSVIYVLEIIRYAANQLGAG